LALIVAVGLINLPVPFTGDQALFTIAALKMNEGAILYRDFWDLKQPGIFGFYWMGGKLFGFTEVGIHTLELIYLTAFSVILIVTLRRYFLHRWMASLAPLLTVGVYYGVAGSWHLTQVESLVGFPLYLAAWFASDSLGWGKRGWLGLFLSGFTGGMVLLFKLMFILVLAPIWLSVLVDAIRRKNNNLASTSVRVAGPVLLGLICPLLPVLAYFGVLGLLPLLYQTFFEYPPRMVAELPSSGYGSLLGGIVWFTAKFAPLMALGFIGACLSLGRRRDLLTVNLVLWSAVGLMVILIQRRSWWAYQYLLVGVPLGILTARALDILWLHVAELSPALAGWKGRLAAIVALALLFSPILSSWLQKGVFLAYYRYPAAREQRLAYQTRFNPDYSTILKEVAFLTAPASRPGDIFVCGNPLYYYLSDRNQAIALNGWALELLLPEQWTQLNQQLAEAMPPYIYIDGSYADLIPERSPTTAAFLNGHYRALHTSTTGVWHELKTMDAATP
jgi:hypothetical protein